MPKPTMVVCVKCSGLYEVYARVDRKMYKCLNCIAEDYHGAKEPEPQK